MFDIRKYDDYVNEHIEYAVEGILEIVRGLLAKAEHNEFVPSHLKLRIEFSMD
jgi:hypothetical protein